LESLDIFINFFVKPLFKLEHIEKEIFAVNSEFEKNIHSDEKRFDRLFQSMANPLHPFSKFSTGNKKTIKVDGITHHALRDKVVKYFHKHYIGRNIKIIVYTNHELENVKNILFNNIIKIHDNNNLSTKEKFLQKIKNKNGGNLDIYAKEQKGKIVFYKSRYKTMKIFFFLRDMKDDLDHNPKMFFKFLFSMKYRNSLLDNLIRQRLIFNYIVDFKDKYKNLNTIYFKFLLTENGLNNLEKIIKILSEFLEITHEKIANKKLFEEIKEINNQNFLNRRPIKNAYSNMKRLTKYFYLFGEKYFIAGDSLLKDYNQTILHEFIKNMNIANSQIYVGARSFKHFNQTYLYKVLGNQDFVESKNNFRDLNDNDNSNNVTFKKTDSNSNKEENTKNNNESNNSTLTPAFLENEFLNQKEKWYKTKYKEFKIDEDRIWHIFKRDFNGTTLEYPNFSITKEKKKILKKASLCLHKISMTKLSKLECRKLYINDRKEHIPNFIFKNNHSEVYLKTDRLHLEKSFILNIKLIPKYAICNLENNKNIGMLKLLIIYLNFIYSETRLRNNNFYDYQTQVSFKDNYIKKITLFQSRNSKEKLSPQDFQMDGIFIKIKSKSSEIFDKSDTFNYIKKLINEEVKMSDFIFLKEELHRYIEFYKSSNPTHQAYNWLYRLGFKNDINYLNMTSSIRKIKILDFNNFKNSFFNNTLSDLKILTLGVGTLNETKMIEYSIEIEKAFIESKKYFSIFFCKNN